MLTDTVSTTRRRRSRVRSGLLAGLASTALVSGLLLTGSVIASNSTLNNFEIEGDLQQGIFPGSSDPTAVGEDWVNQAERTVPTSLSNVLSVHARRPMSPTARGPGSVSSSETGSRSIRTRRPSRTGTRKTTSARSAAPGTSSPRRPGTS